MTDSEQDLLAAMASGDRKAFESIYLAHKDDLLTVLVWLFGDRSMAEDILHDVFVSLVRRAKLVRLRGTLRNYLITSCVNRAHNLVHRRKRGESIARDTMRLQSTSLNNPAYVAAKNEEYERVVTALAALPEEQREVVTLRSKGKLTFREIAELLAISINTAQSRYRYALSSLKTILVSDEGVEQ